MTDMLIKKTTDQGLFATRDENNDIDLLKNHQDIRLMKKINKLYVNTCCMYILELSGEKQIMFQFKSLLYNKIYYLQVLPIKKTNYLNKKYIVSVEVAVTAKCNADHGHIKLLCTISNNVTARLY